MLPLFTRCDSPEVLEVIYHFLCRRTRCGLPLIEKFGKMTLIRHPDQVPEIFCKKNRKAFGAYMPTEAQPGPAEYVLDYGDENHRAKVAMIVAGKCKGFWRPAFHATAANCAGKIFGDGVLLPSSDPLVGQRYRIGDVVGQDGEAMEVIYLHGRETDAYKYFTTVRLTETKWLAVMIKCWINREAGNYKGWGVDGLEVTNDAQKPIPPHGVVIDKIKFYVMNFHHSLNGSQGICFKTTPWEPMKEAQWAERCKRNEPPEAEEHRRRQNVLPPETADAEWWKRHAVYEEGPARPCAREGCARHASRFHHPAHGIPYVTCGTKCEEAISGSPG